MLVGYLEDVKSVLRLYELNSGSFVAKLSIPIGSISSTSSLRTSPELFFSFTSFTTPTTIYRADLSDISNIALQVFRKSESGFNSDDFETRQVFYPSRDGTQIPMFIVSKKGLELNSQSPCILTAYGSHGIIRKPRFSSSRGSWLSNYNGIYCVANIRGGGAYGQKRHYAGQRANKQTTYNDFIDAGDYLVNQKYTSKGL